MNVKVLVYLNNEIKVGHTKLGVKVVLVHQMIQDTVGIGEFLMHHVDPIFTFTYRLKY